MSANPARASVNVNVDPALLSRLAARVGANSFLTVHRLIDLSRSGLADAAVAEFKVSQALASAQADAAAEVQGCRFRPQPNIIVSLRLRDNPLGDAGTKAAAQALLLRAPLNLRCLTLSNVGTGDVGTAALVAALAQSDCYRGRADPDSAKLQQAEPERAPTHPRHRYSCC